MTPARPQPTGRWRKQVHIAFGGCALLLRWLPFAGVVACAVAAMVFNLLILPRSRGLVHVLYREREDPHGVGGGIFWYPIAVFVAILAFPLPVAAAGWGFLAVGDGAAALVGQRVESPRLPWNRDKSVAGSAAFLLCGTVAAAVLFLFVRMNVEASAPWWRGTAVADACLAAPVHSVVGRIVATGVGATLLESLPLRRVDDNVTVPLAGGALLLTLFL